MKSVIYVGTNGFPKGAAETEKQKLILKCFQKQGYRVKIIAKKNYYSDNFPHKGIVDGIPYFYTTYTFRKKGKIEKRIRTLIGQFVEKWILLKSQPDVLVISSRSILEVFSYYLICKLTKSKSFLTYVEDIFCVAPKFLFSKANKRLFNKYAFKLVDGALPISSYLEDSIKKGAPNCPTYKLPILVDIDEFNLPSEELSIDYSLENEYLLYCGSIAYQEVIQFIINGYEEANVRLKLILIIHGDEKQLKDILSFINNNPDIYLYSGISYRDLVHLYKNATGLIIPLRENIQDKARFPHKIGEYCASGNPIITNDWGEIRNYFTNLKNAYISKHYSIQEYAEAIRFIEANPRIAKQIGNEGRLLAEKEFNYKQRSSDLVRFIENV